MACTFLLLFLIMVPYIFLFLSSDQFIVKTSDAPHSNTILVLGAGVKLDGNPSKVLEDRLISAFLLYKIFSPDKYIESDEM